MAFGSKKTLRVEFIEARTEKVIGYDDLRLRDIPDAFKDDTWVEIDYDRWKVVRVEPDKMRQAKRDGLLKAYLEIVLRRPRPVEEEVEVDSPVTVVEEVKETPVFRNPSRADQLPRMSGKRDGLQLLEIATYEWRDIEFVVENNRSTVKEVFSKIAELIHLNSTQRDGRTFYTRQYDRYDMFAPMRGTRLPLETVITDYFPTATAVDGLTFMGSEQVADSTFVFRVNAGIGFYGQEFDDIIRYLAVVRPAKLWTEQLHADATQIAAMMKRKELLLVDWQGRKIIEADADHVYDFFLQGFADHAVATAKGDATSSNMPVIPLEQPQTAAFHPQNEVKPVADVHLAPKIEVPLAEQLNPVDEQPATPTVALPTEPDPKVTEAQDLIAAESPNPLPLETQEASEPSAEIPLSLEAVSNIALTNPAETVLEPPVLLVEEVQSSQESPAPIHEAVVEDKVNPEELSPTIELGVMAVEGDTAVIATDLPSVGEVNPPA